MLKQPIYLPHVTASGDLQEEEWKEKQERRCWEVSAVGKEVQRKTHSKSSYGPLSQEGGKRNVSTYIRECIKNSTSSSTQSDIRISMVPKALSVTVCVRVWVFPWLSACCLTESVFDQTISCDSPPKTVYHYKLDTLSKENDIFSMWRWGFAVTQSAPATFALHWAYKAKCSR